MGQTARSTPAQRPTQATTCTAVGAHPSMRAYCRADDLSTNPSGGAQVVRTNPGGRAAVPIIPMMPAPPARALPLTPDSYRPGPVDLSTLEALVWDDLEHAPAVDTAPALVRQLIVAADADWVALLWGS